MKIKDYAFAALGVAGGLISAFIGDYSMPLRLLLVLMIVDFILGLMTGLFLKSTKTQTGGLSSKAGFKGLAKKFVIIIFVGIGYNLDLMLETHMIREMVIIGYSANELISIVEHAGVMGVPVPPVIEKTIDILNQKAGEDIEA